MKFNVNLNKPKVKRLPVYNNVQVLKILHVSIGEDQITYKCIMDDGTIQNVPIELFEFEEE